MFQSLSSSVGTALDGTCPSLPAAFVIDVERMAPEIFNKDVIVAEELSASSHALYRSIAIPVLNRGSSSTIARLPKKRRLNAATASATAVVNDKVLSDAMEVGDLLHL